MDNGIDVNRVDMADIRDPKAWDGDTDKASWWEQLRRHTENAADALSDGHIIIGAGQVGTALAAVLQATHKVHLIDLDTPDPNVEHPAALHICIPWSDTFTETVKGHQQRHPLASVIVHSTVPIGTCDPHGWTHSPIRGRHPNLEAGIRAFPKHVGGAQAHAVAHTLNRAGIATVTHPRAADTEAGKLWELAQYGIQVRAMRQIHDYCAEHGLDFDVVYGAFAHTYNDGYAQLEPQFVRPVLDYMPGPLGGHCVGQNAALLGDPLVDDLLAPILPKVSTP